MGGRKAGLDLSGAEEAVAELAAQGRSTKEIAATLHLAPKSVEGVLSRVYRKLGVANRAQLAHQWGQERNARGATPSGR